MSSLVYKDGRATIYVVCPDGRRRPIRFGECNKTQANTAHDHINNLEHARNTGSIIRLSTAEWVSGLPVVLRRRVEKAGLIEPQARRELPTLKDWIKSYLESRSDVKTSTRVKFDQVQKKLIGFFGERKRLDEITASDAEDFQLHLKKNQQSEGSTRRLCGIAKQFFHKAVKKRLIAENPFDDIKCANFADHSRFYFVTPAEAQKVLSACPDDEWRLIFALCRYGALRCPTEVLRLTWDDIDWANDRFTVHAVKTEHHENKGVRIVPIFPELKPYLQRMFDQAEPGTKHIINRYRDGKQNLRTKLARIVKKAGMKPWPKLFVNLRSTRVTELCEIFPSHVVAAWAGHSEQVERKHYLQVTDDHFEKAVRQTVRPIGKLDGTEGNTESENAEFPCIPVDSKLLQEMDLGGMGVIGLEPMTSSTSRMRSSQLS